MPCRAPLPYLKPQKIAAPVIFPLPPRLQAILPACRRAFSSRFPLMPTFRRPALPKAVRFFCLQLARMWEHIHNIVKKLS